jgi:Phosphoenolpyruvate carboxykinase (ATP)
MITNQINKEVWNNLNGIVTKQLSNKKLYVIDAFCGANKDYLLESKVCYGSSLAGSFCKKYVY